MIVIKKLLKYGKYIGIFILIELLLAFILGLLNLIGLNSYITNLISFIVNISLFFCLSFQKGKNTTKKGFVEGIINGSLLLCSLFIITLIFFIRNIKISILLYYLILMASSIIGSILGKNTKKGN